MFPAVASFFWCSALGPYAASSAALASFKTALHPAERLAIGNLVGADSRYANDALSALFDVASNVKARPW